MIRPLQWKDMEDLIDNYYSFYDELESGENDLGLIFFDSKPDMPAEIQWFSNLYHDMLQGNAVAVVAEEDGHAVGLCDVHRLRPGSEVSHTGNLGIAIRHEYRGKGLGQGLIKAAIDQCRGKFETIILAVFDVNQRAISLYQKMGFKEYGKFPDSVKRGGMYFDEIHMYLKI